MRGVLAQFGLHAAADALHWLGTGRAGVPLNSGIVRMLVAEVRAGTRTVGGSPEPAGEGGGDDADAK